MSASAYASALVIQGIIVVDDTSHTLDTRDTPDSHRDQCLLIRKLLLLEGIMIIICFCSFGAVVIIF